ncbi:MAG: threonylcarbamoyl-AMP synthase [Myxococcales bacterium]|nr:threonylcarbamoyl-AMP synthase [Myxococcales bacterium]
MRPATAAAVAEAVALLRAGRCVGMPTETVYGLAADGLRADAAAQIFATKRRPAFDPLILHVAQGFDLGRLAQVSVAAQRLADALWPGPLTLLLPKAAVVPDLVTSGLPTVAVRCPDHPVAQALLQAFDGPLAAPSANRFGRISPTTAQAVAQELGDEVPLVLDGGPCRVGLESTIVDLAHPYPRIVRRGGLVPAAIEAALGQAVPVERPDHVAAPGVLDVHYAPRTPLYRLDGPLPAAAQLPTGLGYLYWQRPAGTLPSGACVLSEAGDDRQAAVRLFAHLRTLDGGGHQRIVAEPVPLEGLGAAVADRLLKASVGQARWTGTAFEYTARPEAGGGEPT